MAEMTLPAGGSTYPVALDVTPQLTDRNRLTVLVRFILAIPHLILVGGPWWVASSLAIFFSPFRDNDRLNFGGSGGLIGVAAGIVAIITWFVIVFTRSHPRSLWDFGRFYLRWRVNAVAYVSLLRDEYPPFGASADYPVQYEVSYPEEKRDWLSVFLRILYVIPHGIVLIFLELAWGVVTVIAWVAILITGSYPQPLYDFSVGVFRWSMRVETYGLLMRDEYPPFSFDP